MGILKTFEFLQINRANIGLTSGQTVAITASATILGLSACYFELIFFIMFL
jgi:hypothetical protein